MSEVGPADRSRLLRSKQDEHSSILSTRKRKFSQFFAAAAAADTLPSHEIANPNAPRSNPNDLKSYDHSDLLQGKKFGDGNLSNAPLLAYDGVLRFFTSAGLWTCQPDVQARAVADTNGRSVAAPPPTQQLPPSQPPRPIAPVLSADERKRQSAAQSPAPRGVLGAPSVAAQTKEGKRLKTSGTTPPLPAASPAGASVGPRQAAEAKENGIPTTTTTATPTRTPTPTPKPPLDPRTVTPIPPLQAAKPVARVPERKEQPPTLPNAKVSPVQETPANLKPPVPSVPSVPPIQLVPRVPSVPSVPPPSAPLAPSAPSVLPAAPSAVPQAPVVARPPESGRPQDAISSPASSAASATTPAVQDVSATTSPEKDEVRATEGKHEDKADGDEVMADAPSLEAGPTPGEAASRPPPAPTADDQVAVKPPQQQAPMARPTPNAPSTSPPSVAGGLGASDTVSPLPPVKEHEISRPPTPPAETAQDTAPVSSPTTTPTPTPIEAKQDVPPRADAGEPMELETPSAEVPSKEDERVTVTADSKPCTEPTQEAQPSPSPELEPPQPERAVTRVSSGAMRQKSVSEILGRTHRPQPSERVSKGPNGYRTLTPRLNSSLVKRKERERKHASTVVFGKQPRRPDDKVIAGGKKQGPSPADDYFTPLFIEGFVSRSTWMKPLGALLNQAHKTISSSDALLAYEDDQACKILRRVYQLQHGNKWSLRQLDRCPEPTRPPSHMDMVMQEMKWMRTDFREERKWKMATASILAYACAVWHASDPEKRALLQVSAVPPPKPGAVKEVEMGDAAPLPDVSEPVSDLVSPGLASHNLAEMPRDDEGEFISPAAIFSLSDDQAVFPLRQSAAADLLLSELPLYGSPLKVPSSDAIQPDYDPDALWRRRALPLSKYVDGELKLATDDQPTWQSKFLYEEESDDEEMDKFQSTPATQRRDWLPPGTNDVALFNPEMKPIRDRLHAGHQFRPPTEHPMPPQSFYENRVASQWMGSEDDELRSLVGQYSYNWSLISDALTPRSSFASGTERRTAWECFERWLQLEPLSTDLAKTQYFRAYNHRIDNAQRVIVQQQQAAQQQAVANGQPAPKRRQCVPMRVERRHNRKHIDLLGAMMKVAKKREATLQKQQAQATVVAMRKSNETSQQQQQRPQHPLKTPRDYSLMRWERDQALAEKMAQYAQRQEAQKRAALQARQAQASMANAGAAASGGQVPQNQAAQLAAGGNAMAGVPRVNMPSQFATANQQRPGIPLQGGVGMNGLGPVPAHLAANLARQVSMNGGVPQAQLQGMQGQQRVPIPSPADAHVIAQARRISEQQRAAVQQQHQVHPQLAQHSQLSPQPQGQQSPTPGSAGSVMAQATNGRQGSPANLNGQNQQSFMNNAQAVVAQLGVGANAGSPLSASPLNALQNASLHAPAAASPRPQGGATQMSAITSHIALLETQFRQKHPAATPEQARHWATEQLKRVMLAQRTAMSQQAMNAAAGGATTQGIANGVSPAQYAAMFRQQQAQAQALAQAQAQAQAQAAQAAQGLAQQAQQTQGSPLQPQTAVSTPQSLAQQHQRTSSGSATPGK